MNNLPFAISDEAAASIEYDLESIPKLPRFVGLCPVLSMAHDFQMLEDERIMQAYKGKHFGIGLDYPERIAAGKYIEFTIGTCRVWMDAEDLAELRGKRLVLEAVAVGVPNPNDKKVQMLLAVELPAKYPSKTAAKLG